MLWKMKLLSTFEKLAKPPNFRSEVMESKRTTYYFKKAADLDMYVPAFKNAVK